MRKSFILAALVLSILGLNAGGCTLDVSATRPGESLTLQLKPSSSSADQKPAALTATN